MGIKLRLENSNLPVISLKSKSRRLQNGKFDYYCIGQTEKNLKPENFMGAMFGNTKAAAGVNCDLSVITYVEWNTVVPVGYNISDIIGLGPLPSNIGLTGTEPYTRSCPIFYNPYTGYITNDERYQGGDDAFFHYSTKSGVFLESGKRITRFGADAGSGIPTARQLKDLLPGGTFVVDDVAYDINELGATTYGEITVSTPSGLIFLIGSGKQTPGEKMSARAFVRLQKNYNIGDTIDKYDHICLEGCLINGEEIVSTSVSYTEPYTATLTTVSGEQYKYTFSSDRGPSYGIRILSPIEAVE